MSWCRVRPVIDPEMQKLCSWPYPNHKKGCPNFGKKKGCPPCKLFDEVYELGRPVYAVYTTFNFFAHVERMRYKHPEWSKRQLEWCLYWQGTARKGLREDIARFTKAFPGMEIIMVPEAMGVNVTATLARVRVHLEWPPEKWTHQVALAAFRRE